MKLTEKQKNCPYCHVKGADHHIAMIYDAPKKLIGLQPQIDGFHIFAAVGWDESLTVTSNSINYCPKCGRPLNQEENNDN